MNNPVRKDDEAIDVTTDPRSEFLAGLHELYNFYAEHPEFPLPARTTFSVGTYTWEAPGRYADLVRMLGGEREKNFGDNYVRTTRNFGPLVDIEVWVTRETVCERQVVGTKTKVTTALACVHCDQPIRLLDEGDGVWLHVDGAVEWLACEGQVDDGVTSKVATPPDFTAVSTTTTDVVEWDCKPILADTEAAG